MILEPRFDLNGAPSEGVIYLASPYSHPSAHVRHERFRAACKAASQMMGRGHLVFSPIAHTHPIAEAGGLPLGWEFWERYDRALMCACSHLVVLALEGWAESKGVNAEIELMITARRPVLFTSLKDLGL